MNSYEFHKKVLQAGTILSARANIIKDVNKFLNVSSDVPTMTVMEYNQCLAIVTASERLYMEFQGWHDYNTKPSTDFPADFISEIDIKQELIEQEVNESVFDNALSQFEDLPEIDTELLSHWDDINEPSTSTGQKRERKPSPKWLSAALARSKSVFETSTGPRDVWTCIVCKKVTCRTYTGMRLHLVKFHQKELAPAMTSSMTIKKEIFNMDDEPTHSSAPVKHAKDPNWIRSMVEKSQEGTNKFWKCCICRNVTSASHFGMQLHITRIHCVKDVKTPQTSLFISKKIEKMQSSSSDESIDAPSDDDDDDNNLMEIAMEQQEEETRHARDPIWMDEMIQKSKNDEGAWTCCICKNVTSVTLKGIRIHISRMHCKPRANVAGVTLYGNFWESDSNASDEYDSDFSNYAPNSAKILRKDKEIEYIKEAIDNSKVITEDILDDTWNCCVCQSFTSKSHKGIRIHISRMHLKEIKRRKYVRRSITSPSAPAKRFSREDDINEKVEKCRKSMVSSDGFNEIYICYECENVVCKDEEEIRQHIISEHSHDGENGDDLENDIKLTRFEKKQLAFKIRQCKVLDGIDEINYTCESCGLHFKSYTGIRYHILKRHFKNPDNSLKLPLGESLEQDDTRSKEDVIKIDGIRGKFLKASEMEESDHKWVKECISKSKLAHTLENRWKCWLCRKKYSIYGMIRYHVITVHLPYWKLGFDEYSSHVEQYKKAIATLSEQREQSQKASRINSKSKQIRGKFLRASEMAPGEKIWLKASMKRSRMGTGPDDGWTCYICRKEYSLNNTIRYHLLVRHLPYFKLGEREFSAHVEGYKKSKLTAEAKKLKLKQELHQNAKRCNWCDIQFTTKFDQSNHMKMHEQVDCIFMQMKFPKCDLCPMMFKCIDDLTLHMAHHNMGEEPTLIPSEGILMTHNNTFTLFPHVEKDDWKIQCGHCAKMYETEMDIQRHISLHHMNPFVCPYDQREFTLTQPLMSHLNSSHNDVLGLKVKCIHCDAEFATYLEKLQHYKECTKKPLECDLCSKKFSSKYSLLVHLKKEFGIREWSCHVCGKRYASQSELKTHINSHSTAVSFIECPPSHHSHVLSISEAIRVHTLR